MILQKVAKPRGIYDLLHRDTMTPDAPARVRQRIARLLDDRGLTQRALAKALGHGDQWASNVLSGRSNLAWEDLDKVAAFLRVPPSEIVRVSEDAWELTPTEMRVVRALRMLPPVVRDHLATMIDYLIGSTPDEVVLLKRIRQLTPGELRRIEHWIDVTLLAQGTAPALATHADLQVTSAVRAASARRVRKRE